MMNSSVSPAFENKEEFKAWRHGFKDLHAFLGVIIFEWRGSSAKVASKPNGGVWAAYDRAHWMKKSGLSADQVKRYFGKLQALGLIERERHRYAGSNNLVWVRPTAAALEFMSNRPQDKARLGKLSKAVIAPPVAPPDAPPLAPPVAPSDYTSFPYSSNKTTIQQADFSSSPEEGEGKAGGNLKSETKTNVVKLKFPAKKVVPAIEPIDEIEAIAAAIKAKKLDKLKAQFPVIEGPHQAKVKHPGDMHGWATFAGWSSGLQAKRYGYYLSLIDNWKGGKAAKAVPADDVSDETWAKFQEWVNTPDDAAAG